MQLRMHRGVGAPKPGLPRNNHLVWVPPRAFPADPSLPGSRIHWEQLSRSPLTRSRGLQRKLENSSFEIKQKRWPFTQDLMKLQTLKEKQDKVTELKHGKAELMQEVLNLQGVEHCTWSNETIRGKNHYPLNLFWHSNPSTTGYWQRLSQIYLWV